MAINLANTTVVFCDGACSGNPGRGGWGVIIVSSSGQVRELGAGEINTTNNRMELSAAIAGLKDVSRLAQGRGAGAGHDSEGASAEHKIFIFTDSVYVIRGITQWVFAWRKRGWKTADGSDVANQDLWEELSHTVGLVKKSFALEWHFVRGHSGVPGNERCDEIAVAFTKGEFVNLYHGPLLKYAVAVHDIPEDTSLPEMKEPGAPKLAAYSYLSLHGGIPMRHSTWAECERRVKGQSGAKFKKAMSSEDEAKILREWGVDPSKLK